MTPEYRRQPLVSIVIPTVNQIELVEKCVVSILKSKPSVLCNQEIIVVDDGSPPELQRDLRRRLRPYPVRLLLKEKNTGFAATVNMGAARSKGDYLCLVNSDVLFPQKYWLDPLLREARKPRTGVVGARLLYPDGRIQHGGVIYLPAQRTFDHEYRYRPGNYVPALRRGEALAVTGALMLVNKGLWERMGGMDERFFIALEDVDFSLRVWEEGWRVIYAGDVMAVHHEGLTRGRGPADKNPFWFAKERESIERFSRKWRGRFAPFRVTGGAGSRREDDGGRSLSRVQALRWQKIAAGRKRTVNSKYGVSRDESTLCQLGDTGVSGPLCL
ncbi:MAG: glycosyltransferase family 2 protein [Clostridia bacterium]|nr:glycosyltransferase family 2 protein [Clostridia bacterium]